MCKRCIIVLPAIYTYIPILLFRVIFSSLHHLDIRIYIFISGSQRMWCAEPRTPFIFHALIHVFFLLGWLVCASSKVYIFLLAFCQLTFFFLLSVHFLHERCGAYIAKFKSNIVAQAEIISYRVGHIKAKATRIVSTHHALFFDLFNRETVFIMARYVPSPFRFSWLIWSI